MGLKPFHVRDYLDRPEVMRAYIREVIMEWGGLFEEDADRIVEALHRAGITFSITGEPQETWGK